ncbi:PP2C family protein-serine/threonine phosphatase [Aeromicrobium duanguangcaii]|uniref:Serine/threonine-protein phosphatase n=1 Tax=Aeromicrobium duanguangcaii TaxID=2968086 RepID=A0ABY5KHF0_9ACTN|nr:PP2C family protein-serine/threonine phosphatase [Aeromicrobium duanguangcaii]MCD9153739.1 serine/threonine-protein phosphatase [Aeromicrobium duanguangcaii]MCL3836285.1 serine/threonine-protein phosphatase [Aeromicrobium duanguangcaii]UUI69183.1 serine/threonine-protein phosphatase [Aeromicrobium duanguangcaii]
MSTTKGPRRDPVGRYLSTNAREWRTGSRDGQMAALAALLLLTGVMFILSLQWYWMVPVAMFVVPLILGGMLLQWWPQAALTVIVLFAATVSALVYSVDTGAISARPASAASVYIAAAILLYSSSRNRSGLPAALGEAMLMELRDRLQAQGAVPPLPPGWASESAMESAGSAKFAGDFLVANLSKDEKYLEMVLVDVCGKGVAAGTQSLQLAGALGGLIGSLPPLGLFAAGNDYLLRQSWDEGFATAVHVLVNLETGGYEVLNAGHPPAMHWKRDQKEWVVSGARGLALGIIDRPEFHGTSGVIEPGEALMFYTDGVVETRTLDLSVGVEWLRGAAAIAISQEMAGAPRRILDQTEPGEDDRAVLILHRLPR